MFTSGLLYRRPMPSQAISSCLSDFFGRFFIGTHTIFTREGTINYDQ